MKWSAWMSLLMVPSRWEFKHLDDDLKTSHIERELARHREEIFECDFAYVAAP